MVGKGYLKSNEEAGGTLLNSRSGCIRRWEVTTEHEHSYKRWCIQQGVPTTALDFQRAQWKGLIRWGGLWGGAGKRHTDLQGLPMWGERDDLRVWCLEPGLLGESTVRLVQQSQGSWWGSQHECEGCWGLGSCDIPANQGGGGRAEDILSEYAEIPEGLWGLGWDCLA